MGLLTREERRRLTQALLAMPNILNPAMRHLLLTDLSPALLHVINFSGVPLLDISAIIDTTDGPAAQRSDGSWPIITVVENAFNIDTGGQHARDLQRLLDTLHARASALGAGVTLESIVNTAARFADVETWIERMGQIMRAVCLIETPHAVGTGFLVGPDLVLTNDHVVNSVLGSQALLDQVRLTFDHRTDSRGNPVNPGCPYRLNPGCQPIVSPEHGLDFALLALDGRPGAEQLQGRFGSGPRGFLTPVARRLEQNQLLFVIQHPQAAPLKVAVDRVVGVTPNRVRYQTNTQDGSSGSPCFNEHWELVALHHASDPHDPPAYNQGVPFSAILEHAELRVALGL